MGGSGPTEPSGSGPSQLLSAFRGPRRRVRAHFSRHAASPQSLHQSGSDSNNGAAAQSRDLLETDDVVAAAKETA